MTVFPVSSPVQLVNLKGFRHKQGTKLLTFGIAGNIGNVFQRCVAFSRKTGISESSFRI